MYHRSSLISVVIVSSRLLNFVGGFTLAIQPVMNHALWWEQTRYSNYAVETIARVDDLRKPSLSGITTYMYLITGELSASEMPLISYDDDVRCPNVCNIVDG